MKCRVLFGGVVLGLVACSDVEKDHAHDHEHEVITTVTLTLTPVSGGADQVFIWDDPEADGDPLVDVIVLSAGEDYGVTVAFINALESPPEDITDEVEDEGEEHQVFFTGSAVQGPATGEQPDALVTHVYADEDETGLPIGLSSTLETLVEGVGDLTVTLRHLPPESGAAVKQAGLAEQVASEGFGAIGGDNDVQVSFGLEVE